MDGGDLGRLDLLNAANVTEVGVRRSYLVAATGDQQDLIDGLRSASEMSRGKSATPHRRRKPRRPGSARWPKPAPRSSVSSQTKIELLDSANGRLGELVAEEEAARAADEARAAEAARQQELAAAAPSRAQRHRCAKVPDTAQPAEPRATAAPATTAPPPPRPPVPASRPEAQRAVEAALSQVGVPYVYGGASPSQGFDCSGLIYWAYAQAGKSISRPADYQRDDSIPLSYEELQPGDLVFYGEPVSHDAMYIGNDLIVNAPFTGEFVRIQSMWYSSKPMTYGRIP